MWLDENDPGAKSDLSAFTQALSGMGWTEGRNVRMDLRWYGDDTNRIRALARELVGLQPDVILASAAAADRHLSSCRLLCRSHPTRREAGGASRPAADKIRDGPEPQDRQGARSCRTPIDTGARRRGDRIGHEPASCGAPACNSTLGRMAALGQIRPCCSTGVDSSLSPAG
jgi:hypothetical protein